MPLKIEKPPFKFDKPALHAKCKPLIQLHEGLRSKPYVDTVGKVTIGVGRNLTDRGLSEKEVDFLYENDLEIAYTAARNVIGYKFDDLTTNRQAVLVDLSFNLGFGGLREFVKMVTAVQESRYDDAAKEMLSSLWAKQVGKRATKLAEMMRSG